MIAFRSTGWWVIFLVEIVIWICSIFVGASPKFRDWIFYVMFTVTVALLGVLIYLVPR